MLYLTRDTNHKRYYFYIFVFLTRYRWIHDIGIDKEVQLKLFPSMIKHLLKRPYGKDPDLTKDPLHRKKSGPKEVSKLEERHRKVVLGNLRHLVRDKTSVHEREVKQ